MKLHELYCPHCKGAIVTIRPHPEFAPGRESLVRVDVQPRPDGNIFVLGREHGYTFAELTGDDLANAKTAELPLFKEHQCRY